MIAPRFTFTVRGQVRLFGVWHADRDTTEFLTGGDDEPMTQAEIEQLVKAFDGNSPVEWDGLEGRFTETGWYGGNVIVNEYLITLTPVDPS
jgi:hypothetical protein